MQNLKEAIKDVVETYTTMDGLMNYPITEETRGLVKDLGFILVKLLEDIGEDDCPTDLLEHINDTTDTYMKWGKEK